MSETNLLETIRDRIKVDKDKPGIIRAIHLEITASLADHIEKLTLVTQVEGAILEWTKRLQRKADATHGHALELAPDELEQVALVVQSIGDIADQIRDLGQALLEIEKLSNQVLGQAIIDHAASQEADEIEAQYHHGLIQVQTAVSALPVLVRVDPETWTHLLLNSDLEAFAAGWAAQGPLRRAALLRVIHRSKKL